ncbi:MAG TPA: hypothetical protein VGY31_03430 [Terriglobia bacterium]|nr:hypothetical protein [Terriglobia bacterium]
MPEERAPGEEVVEADLLTPEQEKQLKKIFRECIKDLRKEEREETQTREEAEKAKREAEEAARKAEEASKPKIVKHGLFYKKR